MSSEIVIVPFESIDEARIQPFFEALDELDRTFIHAAVLRSGVIESWIEGAPSVTRPPLPRPRWQ